MDAKFWLWMAAVIIGGGIAAAIIFLLVGAALFAWGVLGSLIAFGAIALGIAYIYDRRKQAEYD